MGKQNVANMVTTPAASSQMGSPGDVLSNVNGEWLVPRTLTPLTSTGVRADGWDVRAVGSSHDNRWYSVVEFVVRDAQDRVRVKPMRCMANTANGGRGCILVVTLNDECIATVRQLRLPLERFTSELPRSFAAAETVTSILDRSLKRASAGKSNIQDETLLAEARTLLGRELGTLLTQPGIAIEEITRLGNVSEWADSMTLTEMILVRLTHPDVESLRAMDLGPAHMKIELYPMSQLLSREQRAQIGVQDQASLSGIALAYVHALRQGRTFAATRPVTYLRSEPDGTELLADPVRRRLLETLNQRLKKMKSAPFLRIGAPGPMGALLGVDRDPWFRCRSWTVQRFEWARRADERLPYFMRDLRHSRFRHEEAVVAIVNDTYLLTVRAHHLPFLTDHDPRRAWCNRTPTLLVDRRDPTDNELGRRLGETEARLRVREPGGALVARVLSLGKLTTEVRDTLHEDTGVSRITRAIRLVHLRIDNAETEVAALNKRAPRRARLVLVPIQEAILDPESHGIRDQQSLSSLLLAAEKIGALSNP